MEQYPKFYIKQRVFKPGIPVSENGKLTYPNKKLGTIVSLALLDNGHQKITVDFDDRKLGLMEVHSDFLRPVRLSPPIQRLKQRLGWYSNSDLRAHAKLLGRIILFLDKFIEGQGRERYIEELRIVQAEYRYRTR